MQPFVLTGVQTTPGIDIGTNDQSQSDSANFCKYDYLVVLGGVGDAGDARDRYCGGQLSAKPNVKESQTICSKTLSCADYFFNKSFNRRLILGVGSLKPFRILYHTNECEMNCEGIRETGQKDTNGKNVGFCLNYLQTE